MAIYTLLCEGTAGGPLNNDTVPLPLRDYAVKNTLKATATPSVSRPGSQSFATSTGTVSAGTGTLGFGSLSSDTAATASGSAATILDDKASSASRAANTASSSNTTSEVDQPVLSTAAIAGIAVGGTVLLALLIGAAFFILRRHKRNKSAKMALPPVYEPVDEKLAYGKPELDGQVLQHQYSEMGTGAPMEYAELDAEGED
ncbi:hypothetical protein N0V95_007833 [Ascochyta clinopodiicola]|nr:hypothetical protein N0V95_007833 [Ascochyta clinopodiicola]